jgi:uncharacterized membrane protein
MSRLERTASRELLGSVNRHEIARACYAVPALASKALKFGLIILGLGLVCFLVLVTELGGIGPCTGLRQILTLLVGWALTGIGGLTCVISLPVVLVNKYKARGANDGLSLLQRSPRSPKFPSTNMSTHF